MILAVLLKGVTKHFGFDAGYRPGEPGQRGGSVTRLVQRGQHQFGDVCLARRSRTISPSPAVALASRETLLREPVKHGHNGCVREVALGQPDAYFTHGKRDVRLPEYVHDRTLKLA
jgi:hypothetical protein